MLLTQYTLSLYFHLPYRSFKISPAYITNYGAKPLESGKLDVYLEEWGTLDPNSVGKANIERLGTIGYAGSGGWYANKAACRPGLALDSYAAYRRLNLRKAMNNISYLNFNLTNQNCSKKCTPSSPPTCHLLKYCNRDSGFFENPLCNQQENNNKSICATLYHPDPAYESNDKIEEQIINCKTDFEGLTPKHFNTKTCC